MTQGKCCGPQQLVIIGRTIKDFGVGFVRYQRGFLRVLISSLGVNRLLGYWGYESPCPIDSTRRLFWGDLSEEIVKTCKKTRWGRVFGINLWGDVFGKYLEQQPISRKVLISSDFRRIFGCVLLADPAIRGVHAWT